MTLFPTSLIHIPIISQVTQMAFSYFNIIFLLLLITTSTSSPTSLKLPLHRRTPPPSAIQILTSDSLRLAAISSKSPISSAASLGSGQYLVTLQLGTPPQPLKLIVDTGSDLIWTKCSACINCSAHHHPGDIAFLARKSTSFRPHHCYNSQCRLVPRHKSSTALIAVYSAVVCNHTRRHSPCRYTYTYSDGSETTGFFSKETTTITTSSGDVTDFKNVNFGCAFHVAGASVTGKSFSGACGVLGLGRGPISFSTQLGRKYGNKFSYCLMDYTLSPPPISFLTIGDTRNDSVLTFTPLIRNPLSSTFYYIAIKHVYVNKLYLPIDTSVWKLDRFGNGGSIIDSGTTLTFLPKPAYDIILSALDELLLDIPSPAEPTPGFDLCLDTTSAGENFTFPTLRFKLAGGAVFEPPPRNYFIETAPDVMCWAVQPVGSETDFAVFGNLMQQGFLFEFDLVKSRVGFSKHGCGLP